MNMLMVNKKDLILIIINGLNFTLLTVVGITPAWGNITYERWKEEDGGDSNRITFNVNYVLNGITYSVAVTQPFKFT